MGSADRALSRDRLAAELLVHLGDRPAEIDLLFAVIGAEEHELPCLGLHACLIQHVPQPYAGPASVARQTLERAPVARALEAEDELGAAHLPQLGQRERQGAVHQSRDLQAEGGRVDIGMAVVLRREELIPRRERTVDLADIDDAPVGRRGQVDVRGEVREGHQRLALCEGGQHPVRQAQDPQSRDGETPLENVATGALFRHVRPFSKDGLASRQRRRETLIHTTHCASESPILGNRTARA